MANPRIEECIDKYIECIQQAHLAGIANPVIILEDLLELYLTPQAFTSHFFKFDDIAKQAMVSLRNKLKISRKEYIFEIISELENALIAQQSPFSIELEAMWVAFYKYYSPMLPEPNFYSPFSTIIQQARSHTSLSRFRSFNSSIATILDESALPIDKSVATYIQKFTRVGFKLKQSVFYKLLAVMCKYNRDTSSTDRLQHILVKQSRSLHSWAASLDYLTIAVNSTEGLASEAIGNYLQVILLFFNENSNQLMEYSKRQVYLDLQQSIVTMLNKVDRDIAVHRLSTILSLEIFDRQIKLQICNKLLSQYKGEILKHLNLSFDNFNSRFNALLQFEETRESMLESLLAECKDDEELSRLCTASGQHASWVTEKVTNYYFEKLHDGTGDFDFLISTPIPSDLRPKVITRLLEIIQKNPSSKAITAYFKLHDYHLPEDEVDFIWKNILKVLPEERRYNKEFCELLILEYIPPAYLSNVISAMRNIMLEVDYKYTSSEFPRKLMLLLSTYDQEILLEEYIRIFEHSEIKAPNALTILKACLDMMPEGFRTRIVSNIIEKLTLNRANYMGWPLSALLDFAQSSAETNMVFAYICPFFFKDPWWGAETIFTAFLKQITLNEDQCYAIANSSLDRLNWNLFNNRCNGIENILRFLTKIDIPSKLHSQFTDLIFAINKQFALGPDESIFINLMKILIKLLETTTAELNLERAVDLVNAMIVLARSLGYRAEDFFPSDSMEYVIDCCFLKLLNYFPIEVQIAMLTYTDKLPRGLDIQVREKLQVKFDLLERRTELAPELWREVYKRV